MQVNQIKQQFPQVEKSINRATQALQSDTSAPQELKDSVRQLGTQVTKVGQLVQQSQDEQSIRRVIEELEETGDRAKRAVEQSGNISQQTKTAVLQAHEQISQLKQQTH
jgi:archaellum component FlaC